MPLFLKTKPQKKKYYYLYYLWSSVTWIKKRARKAFKNKSMMCREIKIGIENCCGFQIYMYIHFSPCEISWKLYPRKYTSCSNYLITVVILNMTSLTVWLISCNIFWSLHEKSTKKVRKNNQEQTNNVNCCQLLNFKLMFVTSLWWPVRFIEPV